MAMTPEKKVKQTIAKVLKEMGAYYFFPATGGYGRSGVPDIVGCYEGKFFGIECKAGKNTTTALQKLELEKIEKSAGIAMVVNEDNVATFKEVLQKSKGRTETPDLLDELED
jgi:Holliday junction resolvase